MIFRHRLFLFAAAGLGLLPATRGVAQLVDTSPFLAPGATASAGNAADNAPLELRGIMSTPQGTRYCIYDPGKKSGTWAALNERGNSFLIRAADPARQAITVQSEGRTLRLVLRESKAAALGVAAPGQAGPAGPPAGAAQSPSPADEARRLQAVAEAVRARRLMREQAAQGGEAAPPPAGDQQNPRRNRQQQ